MLLISLLVATLCYVLMITVNGMANALPLNGITTGDVSFKYPNLFQPSGVTFSIWGLIYVALLIYLFIQFLNLNNINSQVRIDLLIKINFLFALSSILNALWLFAWHYDQMLLSTIVMMLLLATLIIIVKWIPMDQIDLRAVFSLYLGWITVATIANITILLVKIGLPIDLKVEVILTVFVLMVGLTLALLWILLEKDYVYGFVIIWAYIGIAIRHFTKENLSEVYLPIQIVVLTSIFILLITNVFVLSKSIV